MVSNHEHEGHFNSVVFIYMRIGSGLLLNFPSEAPPGWTFSTVVISTPEIYKAIQKLV